MSSHQNSNSSTLSNHESVSDKKVDPTVDIESSQKADVTHSKTDFGFYALVILGFFVLVLGLKVQSLSKQVNYIQSLNDRPNVVYVNVDELIKQSENQGVPFSQAQSAITAITYHLRKTGATLVLTDSGTTLVSGAQTIGISDVMEVVDQKNIPELNQKAPNKDY